MKTMPTPRHHAGFTMLELMVVVFIVGLLAAIGTPTFKYVTASNRIASEINGLLGDLQFARSEAVKEGELVTVCIANATQTGCLTTAGGAWQNGWIVFLDPNGNKVVDANEAILRIQPAFTSTDTFLVTPTTFNAVTYNRMGYGPTGQPATINIQLHSTPVNNNWTRCLAINPVGNALTQKYNAGTPACT